MTISGAPPSWSLRRVLQRHDHGCGIACIAMLAQVSYDEARAAIFGDTPCESTSLDDLRWALRYFGFRLPWRMTPFWEVCHTGLKQDALLALDPAPNGMWHWAVWDAEKRRILDPLKRPSSKPVVVGHIVVEVQRPNKRTRRQDPQPTVADQASAP